MSDGKYRRLLSNTAILGAGTFLSKVLVFLLMPLYTSILSSAQYGVADILTQTANLLIPLAAVGVCDGLFRFVLDTGEGEDGRRRVFTTGMSVILVGGALTFALVQALRIFDVFDGYVMLIAAYVLCANLHSAAANFVRAIGKTTLFAAQGILNTVLTIAFNVLFLVVFEMGTLGYVLSVVVADACVTLVLFVTAKLHRELSWGSFDRSTLSAMLKFSVPYIPTTMMWLITSASDRYIVTHFSGAAENGLYAAAYKLPTILTLVCGVFIEAWQFSVVKDADESERTDFFSDVFGNYMGIIFMGASGIIAFSRLMTRLLMDSSYYDSWRYVPILVLATAFSALVSFLGSVYFLEKKSVMSMLTAMSGALVNVILNFVLIPQRGAMGAAVATLISYVAVYAIRAYDTRFYVRFKLHTPKLIINFLLVLAQAVIMVCDLEFCFIAQAVIMAAILAINGKSIVKGMISAAKRLKKR